MKKYFFLFICVVYAIAQPEKQEDIIKVKTRYGFEVERRPVVNFNIFTDYLKRSENPHLILATEVQNDRLQFIKEGDAYQAEYQISVAIRKDKKALFKETWNETVTLDNFEETNAKQEYQYKVYNLNTTLDEPAPLPPGEYECFFEIRDFTSKNSYNNSREFTIKDYHQTGPLATEIAFLKKDNTNLFNFPLSPAPEGLLFTEPYMAYAKVLADSFPELKFNIRLLKDEGAGYQLFYQKYKTIKSDSGAFKIYFDLPEDSLGEGAYRLRFIGLAGDDEISIDKEFSVHWFEKSTYLYKPDLAIRPMQYLMSPEEYKEVKSLSYNDLDRWIKNYWKKKDPTPGTEFNELLDIFFKRVQDANEKFSSRHLEGWETDRGKILILYGDPDEIENRRYATDLKPHVIWKYKKQNLTFVFVDEKHDGEFKLLNEEAKE